MTEETNIIQWIMAALLAAVSWFVKQAIGESRITSKELAEYKIHSAMNYTSRAETQHSLDRIHTRIDDVSTDIKQILHKLPKSEV